MNTNTFENFNAITQRNKSVINTVQLGKNLNSLNEKKSLLNCKILSGRFFIRFLLVSYTITKIMNFYFILFLATLSITNSILLNSLLLRLDPEGKHNPFLKSDSETPLRYEFVSSYNG